MYWIGDHLIYWGWNVLNQNCFNYFLCLLKVNEVFPTKIAMLAFFVLLFGNCVLHSEGKDIFLILKHFAFDTWFSCSWKNSMVWSISIPVSTKSRLQTGYKMQTRYKMRIVDCKPGTKCRLSFVSLTEGRFSEHQNSVMQNILLSIINCGVMRSRSITAVNTRWKVFARVNSLLCRPQYVF